MRINTSEIKGVILYTHEVGGGRKDRMNAYVQKKREQSEFVRERETK